jgi:hypothetical protein
MEALRVAACPNNKAVRSFGFRPADAVSRVDGRAGLRDRHSPATTAIPRHRQMIGYAFSTQRKIEARASARVLVR